VVHGFITALSGSQIKPPALPEVYDYVINHPLKTEIQSDGRIKKWAKINDVDKFLRVILLEDGETVHNSFFDRSFKEE